MKLLLMLDSRVRRAWSGWWGRIGCADGGLRKSVVVVVVVMVEKRKRKTKTKRNRKRGN